MDLYLRLKGDGRDKVFVRAARRNIGYVVEALGDRPLDQYASSDAALFRDWLIARDMAGNTVRRVFSSIRSIVNLAIKEQGLEVSVALFQDGIGAINYIGSIPLLRIYNDLEQLHPNQNQHRVFQGQLLLPSSTAKDLLKLLKPIRPLNQPRLGVANMRCAEISGIR